LNEAAPRRIRVLLRAEISCTSIPLVCEGVIVQYFARTFHHAKRLP
jgi:hypothetical protein